MHRQTALCSLHLRHKLYNTIFKTKHIIYSPRAPPPPQYPLFLRDFQINTSYSGYAENRSFILIQKFHAKVKILSNVNCPFFLQVRVFIKPTIRQKWLLEDRSSISGRGTNSSFRRHNHSCSPSLLFNHKFLFWTSRLSAAGVQSTSN